MFSEKKDERFSPNAGIRKVRISKQYMVYKDELAVKGKVSTTKEKEKKGRYPTIQKGKSRKRNPPKKRMFLQKTDILF